MITAIVLIKAEVDRIPEVAEAIAELDGVSEVYSVTGDVDLIAMVRVAPARGARRRHRRPAQQGRRACIGTQTHIAFRTYSRHDLEAAFSLGLDDA